MPGSPSSLIDPLKGLRAMATATGSGVRRASSSAARSTYASAGTVLVLSRFADRPQTVGQTLRLRAAARRRR